MENTRCVQTDSMEQTASLFGPYDSYMKMIEDAFGVNISTRDNENGTGALINIDGENTSGAYDAIVSLKNILLKAGNITEQNVRYVMDMVSEGKSEALRSYGEECVAITNRGKPVRAKTVGQKKYVDLINSQSIVFGVGPAGTGKTFLAVAMAVTALRNKQFNRIILTRPAVEAGEKLGYLPGDLQSKIDPYLRPVYDALYDMMGAESFQRHLERGNIEIAPLAYMRGRTLDDSFIILDEAQNTTPEQMKMFMTRLGFNSKMVITGDITQIDLPGRVRSGLKEACRILDGIEGISIHYFTEKDVVRHKLVRQIIQAYENYERAREDKGDEETE